MHVREFNTPDSSGLFVTVAYLPSLSSVLHYPVWDILVALPGMAQQPQEQRFQFLPLCAVVACPDPVVWLPVFGIFNAVSYTHLRAHETA